MITINTSYNYFPILFLFIFGDFVLRCAIDYRNTRKTFSILFLFWGFCLSLRHCMSQFMYVFAQPLFLFIIPILCGVYNDYTTSYSGLLDMSTRTPLFLARLKGLLVEVFKCIRGLNPEFVNTIFVMDSKSYDTRSVNINFQEPVYQRLDLCIMHATNIWDPLGNVYEGNGIQDHTVM